MIHNWQPKSCQPRVCKAFVNKLIISNKTTCKTFIKADLISGSFKHILCSLAIAEYGNFFINRACHRPDLYHLDPAMLGSLYLIKFGANFKTHIFEMIDFCWCWYCSSAIVYCLLYCSLWGYICLVLGLG